MGMPEDLAGLEEVIERAIGRIMPPADLQCTSDNPHDTMTFQRGPNVYHCRCGRQYEKDGRGGLKVVR